MPELETQLLRALEQLQQDYSKRLDEWESAFAELRQMYGNTREDNAKLSREVVALSSRVAHLSEQVRRLSR